MGDLYYSYFTCGFLRAGFLADAEGLLYIDICRRREEFVGALKGSGARVRRDPGPFLTLSRELEEYMNGARTWFSVETVLGRDVPGFAPSVDTPFAKSVLSSTARIPYGQVRTYREVALASGNARAFRAAGSALGRNPFPIVIPCHRVVRTGGFLGQFGGGTGLKRKLLALEGVTVERGRVGGGERSTPPSGPRMVRSRDEAAGADI